MKIAFFKRKGNFRNILFFQNMKFSVSFFFIIPLCRHRSFVYCHNPNSTSTQLNSKVGCDMKMTLIHHPPPTHTNSMSAISQLLLTRFQPNFKVRFLGWTTTITTTTTTATTATITRTLKTTTSTTSYLLMTRFKPNFKGRFLGSTTAITTTTTWTTTTSAKAKKTFFDYLCKTD